MEALYLLLFKIYNFPEEDLNVAVNAGKKKSVTILDDISIATTTTGTSPSTAAAAAAIAGDQITSTTLAVTRKPEITAKQRWHWAYNKIIIQLNVSTNTITLTSIIHCYMLLKFILI